ncbi:hypothetical protein ACH5RR_007875 [Cinchona calisaya]|uniref:Myb/SANT-like DNA-binding domain-containing protein n=1 Tax=Cinchona calisaya TaxID=153742 RepID=A0ABD3AAI4_9GENT
MEDDEDIHSHPSGDTGSPVSPPPPPKAPRSNGRITVTVTSVPPPAPGRAGTGNSGGREDCWSEGATGVLIDAWGERYLELNRGNLKQKHWKDVADAVNSREDFTKTPKTDVQCKNRIDTVKKKYKLEKAKIAGGGGPSKWPFFEMLDQFIGTSPKVNSSVVISGKVPTGKFQQKQPQKQKQQFRKRPLPSPVVDSDNKESDSDDSPPETDERRMERRNEKQVRIRGRKDGEKDWGNSARELSGAILKLGEVYEQAERSKLQQLVDIEKQRMKFAKEIELQRMQLFLKTQLELSQLKTTRRTRRRVGNGNMNNDHHSDHSDSSV